MTKDQLIAHYFSKTLSPEAQKEFDHLLTTDTEFKKAFKFQENLKTVIKKETQTQLKEELQSIENPTKTSSKTYIKWLVAASIILLLALPSFWYFGPSNLDNEALFATNFKPFENVVHPIVRGEDYNDLKTKAFISYEAKEYEETLNYFNALLEESDNATISFYKANVLLQLNKNDEAIKILEQNNELPQKLKTQQQWYLALAYIKINNTKKAKASLNAVINNGTYKTKAAEQLLEQLD
ncbi:tetratricopeptide repeat protein [Winogradskyella bathintestinalis]|uniref:Tetratricopeptide repeat protein n=1 Tax=Winogradskyella bathintestinalis TaxID=3035208 RepID=A0ABT7ZSD1_9FLAO|nr:hypothetical protein [Winogradskyella bathintestinalis]MDN3491912.1 hypothetical protein [Winogradskyella bathintestinalis]